MIRSVWAYANAAIATVVLAPLVLVAAAFRVESGIYDWAARRWCSWILWASGTPVYAEGLENIDIDEPQIFVANHQSWFDVFAIASTIPKRYHFVAKKELERIPLFGPAWKAAGHISIDRSDRNKAIRSLDLAGQQLRNERSAVVIFPEGTRSDGIEMLPFKKGAFMLASHTGVSVVPVGVSGTREVMPRDSWRVNPGPIIVRYGAPVSPASYDPEDRDGIVRDVRARVDALRRPEPRSIAPDASRA